MCEILIIGCRKNPDPAVPKELHTGVSSWGVPVHAGFCRNCDVPEWTCVWSHLGSCFCSLKTQLILCRRWESRWAVMLARSHWPEADGWRRRGIFRRIMRGLLHPGQTKSPSDREMNFWRQPKACAQKCEGAGRHPCSQRAPQWISHSSWATCHVGALPSKSHRSSPGKDQTQVKFIHLLASEGLQAVWWWITSV